MSATRISTAESINVLTVQTFGLGFMISKQATATANVNKTLGKITAVLAF